MMLHHLDMRMKNDSHLTSQTKSSSRRITDLNMKGKTLKLLEENTEKYFYDLGAGKVYLNRTHEGLILKEMINWITLKTRNFC